MPNGYKIWTSKTNTFINARDVIVNELSYLITRPGITISDNGKSDGMRIPGKSKPDKMYKRKIKDSNNDNLNYQNKIKRRKLNNKQIKMNSNFRRSDRFKNKPKISYDDSNTIYDHILYRAVSDANDIPKCYQKIKLRADKEKSEQAVQDELSSLRANQTWTFVERPKGKKIVDCKWVFAIKADEAGNPIRSKAR